MRIRQFVVRIASVAVIATAGIAVAAGPAQATNPTVWCQQMLTRYSNDQALGNLHAAYMQVYFNEGLMAQGDAEYTISQNYYVDSEYAMDHYNRDCQQP